MLRIKEIIVDGAKKFALLRLVDGIYTELGVYARNSYAVKKAKAMMSQTGELIECQFNGVLDVWKLQDGELVSSEADQLQAIERMKALLQKAEQERNFRESNQSIILSDDNSIVQTNSSKQDLNVALSTLGLSLYVIHKANTFMDFIYEPLSWADSCATNQRNALCACAVVGQPRSPPPRLIGGDIPNPNI